MERETHVFYEPSSLVFDDYVTGSYGNENTSSLSVPKQGDPKSGSAHQEIIKMIWMVGGPIIFVVGMCGNAFILVVMTRRKMLGTSTCVHLCIMAIADMVVLLIGLVPEWFEVSFQMKFKEIHPVTCKIEKFLFYTSGDTSIWVLVIFTLDRLVAIAFPLHKKSVCVPSRAKLFGAIALLVSVTKNLHVFWTRGPEFRIKNNVTYLYSNCKTPTPDYAYFESYVRPWIVFATVNVIPFVVILCCNVVIIRALFVVRRVSTIGALVSPSATDRSMIQMTTMCLSASFCFLLCITPSIILVIGRPYWEKTTQYEIAKGISNVLVYINHSVNFFLYCVTGRRFRRSLVAFLCRRLAPGIARAMGGDSTIIDTHATSYLQRSSAFGLPRKSSAGFISPGKLPGEDRRTSRDDPAGNRRLPSYIRSNSQVAKAVARMNSKETDV